MIVRTVSVDGQSVTLRERGDAVDVLLNGVVLLSSAALETELLFGRLAGALLGDRARRVLVGGLGFGATARGVLEACPNIERVVVAERTAAIEHLARGELKHLTGGVLDDPRVELFRGDVFDAYALPPAYDAILLDVDNGPGWASYRDNAKIYAPVGLAAARDALTPGGVFAVWSGYAADAFLGKLRAAGLRSSVELLREKGIVRARAYVGIKSDSLPSGSTQGARASGSSKQGLPGTALESSRCCHAQPRSPGPVVGDVVERLAHDDHARSRGAHGL